MQYVLDTDHFTLLQRSHPILIQRISSFPINALGITVITMEESVQGWLSEIRKASKSNRDCAHQLGIAYDNLRDVIRFLSSFQTLSFTESASVRFTELRQQGVRIGTQDLRIASICLVNDLILLTRNQQDFAQVPNLVLQNWTI
ncbi:type II toxin-antitoxin system VapC family toxin [Cyanobacteria bacterium FACHB-63]|nr:type II toxin-antitoxin system VapC family toxin [Cyanobacteria bacterium FACHB-63]